MPPIRPRNATAVAVAAVAALVAAAGPATAATHSARHSTRHTRPATVKVHGIVVNRSGSRLTVLAHDVTVGRRTRHNRVETLILAGPHARRGTRALASTAGPQPGDVITATGSTTDGTTVSVGTVQAVAPRPARALIGIVSSVNGTLVTLAPRDGTDGEHDGQESARGLVVDTTAATFAGAASSASALTPGEYVVLLGEEDEGDFAAAKVFSYSAEPQFVVGQVSAADPSTNSLTVATADSEQSGDSQRGDDNQADSPAPATSVDTSAADVVINGNDGQQGTTFPAVGDKVLVVGADGSAAQPTTPLAATVVFAFDRGDDQPVGHNED